MPDKYEEKVDAARIRRLSGSVDGNNPFGYAWQ
jgi:hypothetical protein